ncbi:MFS transporter [Candidatus Bathyarchaeota archaeon]|nr:TCR/Tet family MFS transporter [Deltaproteobacteria bacterium]NIU39777.1 MFS transporter [Candidatus Bathyarchaeota archaeon]NIW11031.1 MFS transporter [Gammaproteobacteria bacterium]
MKFNRSKGFSPIFVIVLTVFIDITGYGIIIPLLPFYAKEFQAGPTELGILIASFAIMQFFFSPLLGKASDKKGRKPILLISLLISFISFTIFSFANSYLMLLFSRIIAGIATERAVAQAYIADVTDHKSRTKEMGKIGAALGAGFIIGPSIGGILSTYGFSIPGYAAMILTVINILFVISLLPEPHRDKERTNEVTTGSSGYLRGLRASLRKPLLGPTLLILFIVTLAFSTIPVIVPLLSIDFFNFNSLELSYVFIYIGLIQIVMQGFLINPLYKRLGEERLIALGPILMATGTLLMPIFQNVAIFFLTNSLLAAGFGIINTSIPAFLSKRISIDEQGSILGVAGSVASIANIPGPLIIGLIYDFAGSFVPFLISAVMLTTAFLLGCRVYSACKSFKKTIVHA